MIAPTPAARIPIEAPEFRCRLTGDMGAAAGILGLGLFVLGVLLLATRANEVFRISVRQGRCLVVRGRVPPGLLHELCEVVRRAGVERASIRAVRRGGSTRLDARGVGAGLEQRLRNVFGTRGLSDLRAAPSPPRRNLGQRLGWEWLAWRLEQRDATPERR